MLATIGSSSVADGLVEMGHLWASAAWKWRKEFKERFWSRLDVSHRGEAQQPLVSARCGTYNVSTGPYSINTTESCPVYDLWDQDHQIDSDFPVGFYNHTANEQVHSLIQRLNTSTVSEVVWATVPQLNSSALGAFFFIPYHKRALCWFHVR